MEIIFLLVCGQNKNVGAGKILADAIRGNPAALDAFAALPVPPFPGGTLLRKPALVAGMLWYALRDRL